MYTDTVNQVWYEKGKACAIEFFGRESLLGDMASFAMTFPQSFMDGFNETQVAIRLIKQHGVEKVLGALQ